MDTPSTKEEVDRATDAAYLVETGKTLGIQPKHAKRLRLQLAALDTVQTVDDIDVPGFRLHPLKGKRKSSCSISVNGNCRLTPTFTAGNVELVNYEDYH